MGEFPGPLVLILAGSLIALVNAAHSEPVLVPYYVDPEGFGFKDPTPVEPVHGNPETTLGGQRRAAFEAGLDILSSHIDSRIPIRVNAGFTDFGCPMEGESGWLAFGGTFYSAKNFPGAPHPNTYYPGSLATHLAGAPMSTWLREMYTTFNIRVDSDQDCFNSVADGFWYGIGGPGPAELATAPFVPLVLHELGHGLGFVTWTDSETREFGGNPSRPDVHSLFTYSPEFGLTWDLMTSAQRRQSDRDGHDLVWLGSAAMQWAEHALRPPAEIRVDPPVNDISRFPARLHGRAPFPIRQGLGASMVVASNETDLSDIDGVIDEPRQPFDACQPLSESSSVRGSIVLAVRGGCFFRTKWRHAEQAGAVALVVADHLEPDQPRAMNSDQFIAIPPGVTIPIWTIGKADGQLLLDEPPDRITLAYDETQSLRGTHDGWLSLETNYSDPRSNAIHLDRSAVPLSFMSGGAGTHHALFDGQVGPVPGLLQDLGWSSAQAKQAQFSGTWFNPARSGEGCQLALEADQVTWILTCYLYLGGDQIWLIGTSILDTNRLSFDKMITTRGGDYGYAFDPESIERINWGRIDIEFIDCNTAFFQFGSDLTPFYSIGLKMNKIVPGNCRKNSGSQLDRELSGTFFDPQRDGEGIQITQESDGETFILTWYSYADGLPLWVIGDGHRNGPDSLEFGSLILTHGGHFGHEFDPDQVERIIFGSATVEFSDCNNLRFRIDSALEEFADADHSMTRTVADNC